MFCKMSCDKGLVDRIGEHYILYSFTITYVPVIIYTVACKALFMICQICIFVKLRNVIFCVIPAILTINPVFLPNNTRWAIKICNLCFSIIFQGIAAHYIIRVCKYHIVLKEKLMEIGIVKTPKAGKLVLAVD